MCRRGLLARSCRSLVSSAIAILIGLGICVSELAQTSGVPRNAFYIGLGGSYTSVNFGAQNVYAIGTSNVFQNGVLVATGYAAGPGTVNMPSEWTFAPSMQGGYSSTSRTALGYGGRSSHTVT